MTGDIGAVLQTAATIGTFLGAAVAAAAGVHLKTQHRRHEAKTDEVIDAVNNRHATGTPRLYDLALTTAAQVEDIDGRVGDLEEWRADQWLTGTEQRQRSSPQ